MNLNIEITDRCNLTCPSCPRGRGLLGNTQREMSPALLRQVLEKMRRECVIDEIQLFLENEPTFHSDLAAMILTARDYSRVRVSTNASRQSVDWESIIAAQPHHLVISLSGDTQAIHERAHQGSNLAVVHQSMMAIDSARRNLASTTKVCVVYHRYRYNLHEEDAARKRARRLGFDFVGIWAIILSPDDRDHSNICDMVLSPTQAWAIGRRHPQRVKDCFLYKTLHVDVTGQVIQCGVKPTHTLGDFLSVPLMFIQQERERYQPCVDCAASGQSILSTNHPRLEIYFARAAGDNWTYRLERWRHWLFYLREVMTR